MPSSYGRSVAIAVFVFVLTFSPYAHAADTSAFVINDPFVDAVQLWSAVFSSLDSLAHQIALALQLHQTLTFTAKPHAPKNLQQQAALAASAALATESPPETATTSGSASDQVTTPQQPQTTGPPEATYDQTTQSPFVKSPDFSPNSAVSGPLAKSPVFSPQTLAPAPASAFVTQVQFNAAMSALGASVQELLAKTNTNPTPEYIAGDGNNADPYAAASAIDNLSNVTITNPTITGLSAGEIPNLSGSYLSLGGGTLTGAFVNSGTSSSSYAGALGIGTTSPSDVLAVNGPIFLSSVSPTATADRLYNNGGSLYWAGSPIAGGSVGNWTTDGTNVWRAGGDVGIGTTTPYSRLTVWGPDTASTTSPFLVANSASTTLFQVNDDGSVSIGKYLTTPLLYGGASTSINTNLQIFPSSAEAGFAQFGLGLGGDGSGLPPNSSMGDYDQTVLNMVGHADSVDQYYNPVLRFSANNINAPQQTRSMFEIGAEGNYQNNGTISQARLYAWDFVNSKTIWYIYQTNPNLFIFPSPVGVQVGSISGGYTATSTLLLQSTTGAGATDSIQFHVGSDGATEAMRVVDSGSVGIDTMGQTLDYRS